MRSLMSLLLLLTSTVVYALDTPLVIIQRVPGQRMVTIDPTSGAMRHYMVRGGRNEQALKLMSSHNFRSDLRRLINFRLIRDNPLKRLDRDAEDEVFYSMAQLGHLERNQPSYGDMLSVFGDPKRQQAVLKTEFDFFNSDLSYDGRVQAAYGSMYLMLVVPRSYTILLYRMDKEDFNLVSWHNYRMPLYLTISDGTPFQSDPGFNKIKAAIRSAKGGDVLLAQRAAQMEEVMAKMEEDEKGDLIPIAESDPWLTAMENNRFAMIDPANNRLMLYQIPARDTIELRSVRNIDLDRRLPNFPIPRQLDFLDRASADEYIDRLKKVKEERELLQMIAYVADWVKDMRVNGNDEGEKFFKNFAPDTTDIAVAFFRTLADMPPPGMDVGGKDDREPFDIVYDGGFRNNNGERLYFDIKRERRLITYLLQGNGNRLEMLSQMDYTIDTGIAMYNYLVEQRRASDALLDRIEDNARKRNREGWLMQNVNFLLRMSPWMHTTLSENKRITRQLQNRPDWAAAIDKAIQDEEAYRARFEAIVVSTQQALLAKDRALTAAAGN